MGLDPFRDAAARRRLEDAYDAVLADWSVPFEERDVAGTYGTTHVIVSGPEAAPPLILLHGAACTAAMWGTTVAALAIDHRCYYIDTITEGNKSIRTTSMRTIADNVAWLQEKFAALNIAKADVVGLSYGGWLAANLAVAAPALVDRLVLLCPAATLTRLTAEFYVRMLTSTMLRSEALVARTVRWMSRGASTESDPAMGLVATNLLTNRALRVDVTPPTRLTDDQLRRIGAPTTVLVGAEEVLYTTSPAGALARAEALIPNVRTRLIPGAGHVLTVDAPELVVAELTEALA